MLHILSHTINDYLECFQLSKHATTDIKLIYQEIKYFCLYKKERDQVDEQIQFTDKQNNLILMNTEINLFVYNPQIKINKFSA